MASAQCQKPPATIEACQQKSNHSSLGHKISEMTHKAFKGHQARHGSTNPKPQTHCYSQTHTQHRNDDGVAKTEITLTVLQAHITTTTTTTTQTDSLDHPPYARGTPTTCFGNHTKKNRDHNYHYYNNNKDRNIFRRIKDGISRRNNDSDSSSSSDSDSDRENCPSRKN